MILDPNGSPGWSNRGAEQKLGVIFLTLPTKNFRRHRSSQMRFSGGPRPMLYSAGCGGKCLRVQLPESCPGVIHARSTSALSWSYAFSAGAAVAVFASVSINIERNTTASGRRGLSRQGDIEEVGGASPAGSSPVRILLRELVARQTSPRLRNAATPMPSAPLILPLGAPLAVSAPVGNQLDRRPGSEFGLGALGGRDRTGAC